MQHNPAQAAQAAQRQRHGARQYIEQKIAREGSTSKLHHQLAPLLDTRGSIRHLAIAVHLDPQNSRARSDLAIIYLRLGHTDRALRELQLALESDPDNFLIHKNLSAAYAKSGNYNDGLRHAERAVRLAPDDAMCHRNYALILDQIGNARDSVKHNRIAVARGPGRRAVPDRADAQAYRRLAIGLVGQGPSHRVQSHAHYDAHRALTFKRYDMPASTKTEELLELAGAK